MSNYHPSQFDYIPFTLGGGPLSHGEIERRVAATARLSCIREKLAELEVERISKSLAQLG